VIRFCSEVDSPVAANCALDRLGVVRQPAAAAALVLDLSGVDFLTAEGLGELVRRHGRMRDLGGELVLDNVGARAFEVLTVAGLTTVFDVRRSTSGRRRDAPAQSAP
jgi:anti-anti-sigma factor